MVHHIALLQTKTDVPTEKLEDLMVETRIRLLKIPEVTNLRVGKRIDASSNNYSFFYSFDTESLDKLQSALESAVFTQYEKQILAPFVDRSSTFDYEMEPGKDVRYS